MEFAHFDNMAWPIPESLKGLVWRLRYAHCEVSTEDRTGAAAVLDAYAELIWCTNKKRESIVSKVKRKIE